MTKMKSFENHFRKKCEEYVKKGFKSSNNLYLKEGEFWQNYPCRTARFLRIFYQGLQHPILMLAIVAVWILILALIINDWSSRAIVQFIAANIGIIVAFFWNLDNVFGKKWRYLCDLHLKTVDAWYENHKSNTDETSKNNDVDPNEKHKYLHLILLTDLIDLGMWATPSFGVYFENQIEITLTQYKDLLDEKKISIVKPYSKSSLRKALSEILSSFGPD